MLSTNACCTPEEEGAGKGPSAQHTRRQIHDTILLAAGPFLLRTERWNGVSWAPILIPAPAIATHGSFCPQPSPWLFLAFWFLLQMFPSCLSCRHTSALSFWICPINAMLSVEHVRGYHWVTCGKGGHLCRAPQHLAQCLVQAREASGECE